VRPVNLLPARYRPARASGERPGIGYAAIGALAVLLLMVVLYVLTNNQINDANEKASKAEAEKAAAQARAGQLTAYGDFSQLRATREAAVGQVAEVRFDWERLMREMALVMPKEVYLTAFTGSTTGDGGGETGGATGPTATMSGCAPDHPAVADTIVRLRKMHNVVSVDLTTSAKGATGGATGTDACPTAWTGTVTFKPEAPPEKPTPVPARLGGGQ
jgi:Tfp pilus assembly protein PilN